MTTQYYGKPLDIPIVGVGSQPLEDGDENFNFISSPGEMYTYNPPRIPEPEEVEDLVIAKTMLADLLKAIENYSAGEPALAFDITALDSANLDLVNQILNEGEVSVVYEGSPRVLIQESVLTGIWRLRYLDEQDKTLKDVVEVADIPSIVRDRCFADTTPLDSFIDNIPVGVINAPSLITELAEKIAEWQPGDTPHVINLTLLPLSSEDLAFLGSQLGIGPVTVLSRGYGNCRIGSTAKKNIWWVKYYNSEDVLILNTIEVIDIPEVAKAAAEDLSDSAIRLKGIRTAYEI